ncbi:MAG: hypothetical protein JWM98_1916 [Thermoleophilia bacterium]|nr:hypothetical protein [Thermoleophilia bacterium]
MGGSQLKRSHRTHSLNQPAGVGYGHLPPADAGTPSKDPAVRVLADFQRLVEAVPDAAHRAALLGVPEPVDAAWREGRMLPVLRARARRITELLDRPAAPEG